ncbi:hypothetical protein [Streptomyces sp. SCL15-4]|uniref:hypothetical protein n=1 Tax=Streptomyces sp. SCL15-4 TaxID=2967221 RepID=UPI0029666C7C|nr:hypothetical protein [Streptomyces sp. SCL15-4]
MAQRTIWADAGRDADVRAASSSTSLDAHARLDGARGRDGACDGPGRGAGFDVTDDVDSARALLEAETHAQAFG